MSGDPAEFGAPTRRQLLRDLGVGSLIGLAGCARGDDGDGGDGDGGDDAAGDTATADTATANTATEEGDSGGQGTEPNTLHVGQEGASVELDPVVLSDVRSAEVATLVFEGLYRYDESTETVPKIATADPEVSNGGRRWVVEVNPDATFQNGDPVTPEDVVYSFTAPAEEGTVNAAEVEMIDAVERVDDRTIQFDLEYAYGAFDDVLTRSVVPKAVRERDRGAFNAENPVGSGSFRFVERQEGDRITLERWEDYWGEPTPNLERIRLTPIEDPMTRVTAFENGEQDVIEDIPPQLYSVVKSMRGAGLTEVPGIDYFYLAFNCKEGPTADPTVREAVDYTFDMDRVVSDYVEPVGVRQYSPLPRPVAEDWGMPVDEWTQIPHRVDVGAARGLLEEAGVPRDYPWTIIVPPDDRREQVGLAAAEGLEETGWTDVSVQRLDWGTFRERYNTGDENDYNMYVLGWSGTPDPDTFTYDLFARTDDVLGVTNGTFYGASSDSGERVSEQIVRARQSTERSERKMLYERAITTMLKDRPHLPSYNLLKSFGVRDGVDGFRAHPVDSFHLATETHNVSVRK